mmetsp:Transcript_29435/g.58396  ORF Transcript_29435/g.58396 Transcript_29435/m.58396 type:complete len:126 (-) Transcript_29435:398-775(-)
MLYIFVVSTGVPVVVIFVGATEIGGDVVVLCVGAEVEVEAVVFFVGAEVEVGASDGKYVGSIVGFSLRVGIFVFGRFPVALIDFIILFTLHEFLNYIENFWRSSKKFIESWNIHDRYRESANVYS